MSSKCLVFTVKKKYLQSSACPPKKWRKKRNYSSIYLYFDHNIPFNDLQWTFCSIFRNVFSLYIGISGFQQTVEFATGHTNFSANLSQDFQTPQKSSNQYGQCLEK